MQVGGQAQLFERPGAVEQVGRDSNVGGLVGTQGLPNQTRIQAKWTRWTVGQADGFPHHSIILCLYGNNY